MIHIYQRELKFADNTHLTIPGGSTSMFFPIGFPPAGKITRFGVVQSAWDIHKVDWSATLYDRNWTTDGTDDEMAQILPQLSNANGNFDEWADGIGRDYQNREGTFSVPVRQLYILITLTDGPVNSSYSIDSDQDGVEDWDTHWDVILAATTSQSN